MKLKYFLSLPFGGEINKKDFVEPAFAKKLRRKIADIVCSSYHKYRRLLFLHPGQEGSEDTSRGS